MQLIFLHLNPVILAFDQLCGLGHVCQEGRPELRMLMIFLHLNPVSLVSDQLCGLRHVVPGGEARIEDAADLPPPESSKFSL